MITDLQSTNNNWIYQSNKLIEASYTLTVTEQKLIRLLASMVKKDDDDFKEYEFKTKDLIKTLKTSNSRFYRDIDNLTDLLMQRIIKIKDASTGEFEKYHWIDTAKYKNGVLKLKIHKDLKPFYLSLDWYSKYQIKNVMQFKSTYSFRLYELLKQYENIGYRIISIEDLRSMLEINKNQYPKFANLKQKVIDKAIKEINKFTDLYIDHKEIKTIRKVTSIKFLIYTNNHAKQTKTESAVAADSAIVDDEINQLKIHVDNATGGNISVKILEKLIKKYGTERIKEKMELFPNLISGKNIQNVDGFFVQSVIENYKVVPNDMSSNMNQNGMLKQLDAYKFNQRQYTEEELDSLFDNIDGE